MQYPSYSYLDQATLHAALDMARTLQAAAASIGELANGHVTDGRPVGGGGSGGGGGGGRDGHKESVVRDWIGPTRDTFELLFHNERSSAAAARHKLNDEADAWARFWAIAINARNDRLHDEAVHRYEVALGNYERELTATDGIGLTQRPPQPPVYRPPVSAPTASMGYHPPQIE